MSTDRRKMVLSKYDRAARYAERHFRLEVFIESGHRTLVSPGLRDFIRGQISLAWLRGYDATRGKR